MEYKATTMIQASPEKIWRVLTDLNSWPSWDPFCERVEGQAVLGRKIKIFSKLSPGRAFPVKIVELTSAKRMTFSGGMPFGLFRGVRTYTLAPRGQSGVTFTMHEVFGGPLLPLIGKSIPDMTDAFEKFVAGLKARAEAS